jgi:diacylglycerol kinase family enzyme
MKYVQLIINPHSGYGTQGQLLPDLREALQEAGWAPSEYVTTGPGDATVFARTLPHDTPAVIVVGGDGTVNEVANGLVSTGIPMLTCPVGTENLLAKELRIPASPARLVEILRYNRIVNADVGRINGRIFLSIIGVGFDGEVVRRISQIRTGHISHLSYFWPIWRTFWEHDFPRLRVIVDGEEVFNDLGLAFVGNISRYAVGLRICREARFDDGLLDLVVFGCREQSRLLLHAAWTLLRFHPLKGNVVYRQFRHLRFESPDPVPSQQDGDVGPDLPIDVEVMPGQLRLYVPPQPRSSFWPWMRAPI